MSDHHHHEGNREPTTEEHAGPAEAALPDTADGDGHDEHVGHDKHEGHSVAMFRDRFWLSFTLSVPIIVYSEMVQEWFGYTPPPFPGSTWLPPLLGTIVFVYGGSPFLIGAVREARDRKPGMMLLIGMAITVAFLASASTTFGLLDLEFWWELAALVTIMLLGHWLEMRAIGRARGALTALADLLPDTAERVTADGVETVGLSELRVDDVVLVRPGSRIPADGSITEGAAEVDESMVTGESKPVAKDTGDTVVAGTVATDSAIRVRVEAVGEDTALAGIERLVAEAQRSRSRAQVLADRAAAVLFYVAVLAAAITAVAWVVVARPDQAVVRSVAVLVIACPHALGLAIPLVVSTSTGLAARHGILIKDRLALERMRTVDVVLFDKTGTLTEGRHAVRDVAAVDGDTDTVLALAAAAESDSEHPLARAIVAAAGERGQIPTASDFRSSSGRGVTATVDGARVAVGGPAMLRESGSGFPAALEDAVAQWRERGASVLAVVRDGTVIGAIAVEDAIRPESREAVEELQRLGLRVAMITGDARHVAETVGSELGVDEVLAEILPEDKHEEVTRLQDEGRRVAMVGDGVNDAPALARSDVGIAIGAGTDVAIESAGIVLASDDPRGVVSIRRLSRAGHRKMVQNLLWATGYNVAAIPLAAGAFAWAGIALAPAAAAVLMSASTIVVAVNAVLMRRVDLSPEGS